MSGSQQQDCRKRALTNPPGKGPGAQDPRFCPTSWSLAGSTSLQQGHWGMQSFWRGSSGGGRSDSTGSDCSGQGGRQAHVCQMRAGCPLLCQWVLFPGILRSVYYVISPLSKRE